MINLRGFTKLGAWWSLFSFGGTFSLQLVNVFVKKVIICKVGFLLSALSIYLSSIATFANFFQLRVNVNLKNIANWNYLYHRYIHLAEMWPSWKIIFSDTSSFRDQSLGYQKNIFKQKPKEPTLSFEGHYIFKFRVSVHWVCH